MAVSAGLGFDIDEFGVLMQKAKEADKALDGVVSKMQTLSHTRISGDVEQYLDRLREMGNLVDGISKNPLNINIDTAKLNEGKDALDQIVSTVNSIKTLTDGGKLEFFDPQKLYATDEPVALLRDRLKEVNSEIERLDDKIREIDAADIVLQAFPKGVSEPRQEEYLDNFPALSPEGAKWDKRTKEYKEAWAKHKAAVDKANEEAQAQYKRRKTLFDESKQLWDKEQALEVSTIDKRAQKNEERAILQRQISWADKTVAEKEAIVNASNARELKAEQDKVNQIIKEYQRLLAERKRIEDEMNRYRSASDSGKDLSQDEFKTFQELQDAWSRNKAEIEAKEREHQAILTDIDTSATEHRLQVIKDLEARAYSKDEALALADAARNVYQMQDAQKALKSAINSADYEAEADDIDELKKKFEELREKIEATTRTKQKDNTLEPSRRNEYAKTVRELEKLKNEMKSLEEAEQDQMRLSGSVDDHSAFKASLQARIDALEAEKQTFDQTNQQIIEETKKLEAEKTRIAIEEYKKRVAELKAHEEKFGVMSVSDAQQIIIDTQSVANVRQAEEAVKNLKDTRDRLDKKDAQYEQTVKSLNKEIQKQENYIQSVTNAEKHLAEQQKKSRETATGAIRYSAQAKSLKEIKQAIDYLTEARKKEDLSTKEGRKSYKALTNELERQQKEYERLTNKVKKGSGGLMDIAGQLTRKLALVFSVSQMQGYINKLMEVRGEFELQQRSLQAILQDKDEADKLWNKTVALAVKSPFRIKELVTYTKQLAAYRIEADKLYDTNKMLADISAGLGVDMNRLILAFGQVKSASYLRGTELRQFTEAGIPLLEELSKYFTELEGRIVSVGDVFGRISKRMVDFEDVEEIFKRMTREGGIFFEMQEKQAETLKGQISNLKDSVDVMLNEIGKATDGTLKNGVKLVADFVKRWQDLVDVMKTAPAIITAITLALVRLGKTKMMLNLTSWTGGIHLFDNRIAKLSTRVSKITTMLPNVVGTATAKTIRHMKSLRNYSFLASLGLKSLKSAATAVAGALSAFIPVIVITLLSKLYLKITETSREAKRLKKELDAIFSEDTTNVQKSIDSFKSLVARLGEVNKGSKEHRDIIGQLNSGYSEYLGYIVDEKTSYEQLANSIDEVTQSMLRRAKTASYEKALQVIYDKNTEKLIKEREQSYKELEAAVTSALGRKVSTQEMDSFFSFVEKRVQLFEGDLDAFYASFSTDPLRELAKSFFSTDVIGGVFTETASYLKVLFNIKEAELKAQKELNRAYNDTYNSAAALKEITAAEEVAKERIAELDKQSLSPYEYAQKYKEIQDTLDRKKLEIKLRLGEITRDEYDKLFKGLFVWEDKTTTDINNKIKSALGKYGEEFTSPFLITKERQSKGLSEYEKEVQTGWETQKAYIEELTRRKKAGVIIDEQALATAKKQKEAWEAIAKIIGLDLEKEKEKNKREKEALEKIKERVNLLKEMNQEYEKNRKFMDEDAATGAVKKAYELTASKIGIDITSKDIKFDDEATIKALESLLKETKNEEEYLAVAKILDNYRAEILNEIAQENQKALQKRIDDIFDLEGLTKELKDLGFSEDLAKTFGFEFIDLKEARKRIEALKDEAEKLGKDSVKDYEKSLEKLADLEDKYMKERMKTYSKYLVAGYSERVKLKIEEMKKIKEIEESKEFTPEQKARITQGVEKETNKALQKQEWEDFKNSEMYTMVFDDLEHYGSMALNVLQEKLESLKGSLSDLDATEVKEIISQINKIEDVMIERNPFAYMKDLKKQLKSMKSEEEYQIDLFNAREQETQAQDSINLIDTINAKKAIGKAVTDEEKAQYDQLVTAAAAQGIAEDKIRESKELEVKSAQKAGQEAQKGLNTYKQLRKTLEEQKTAWGDIGGKINDAFDASKELMTALGVSTDSLTYSLVESAQGMSDLIVQAVQFGIQMKIIGYETNMALGVIGWIVIAVQTIAKIISAIVSAKNAKFREEIESHQRAIEKLQKSYEELEKKIDEAWSTAQMKAYQRELNKTYQQQLEKQKAIIAAYEDEKEIKDKKVKSDKYKEYEEEKAKLKELQDTFAENTENIFSKITDGILDDVLDATRGFVDAWYDAFVETGDGLKGLEENFDEMFLNIVKQQAALLVSDQFIKRWKEQLEKLADNEGGKKDNVYDLTVDEVKEWAKGVKEELPQLSEMIEPIFEGVKDFVGNGSGLTALEKGISGITEESAQVIESYLNSLRSYVAINGEQLKEQTKYLKNLWDFFDEIGTATHHTGGHGLKVVI